MNKVITYTWLKYVNSINKLSEFIWHNTFIILISINDYKNIFNGGDKNEKENTK